MSWPAAPEFVVSSPAALASAWLVANATSGADGGPLCAPAAGNATRGCCRRILLDCSKPGAKVFPDPLRPLSVPAVTCPPAAPNGTRLVVFTGDGCPLVDQSSPCWWNSTGQMFQGGGCVASMSQGCACQHLTDFAGARGITIKVASADQMLSLNPADLVTHLKTLFAIVISASHAFTSLPQRLCVLRITVSPSVQHPPV